jgi:hypothetical protein
MTKAATNATKTLLELSVGVAGSSSANKCWIDEVSWTRTNV